MAFDGLPFFQSLLLHDFIWVIQVKDKKQFKL